MEHLTNLWLKTLEIIKPEISEVGFSTWIEPIIPVDISENEITLEVPYDFSKNIIQTRYIDLIKNAVFLQTNQDYYISIRVRGESAAPVPAPAAVFSEPEPVRRNDLNPDYTFSSFVIGKSNQFAHAACLAVSEGVNNMYNPLFLYGGVGLGKTHLMHAVGNMVLQKAPHKKIMYVSSEKFTIDLINSIKDDRTEEFREKYRAIDLLMIDDIQFIGGKEGTQEEFFHTFNTLHQANKQIIITSDRPPKELVTLEERLRTRLASGIIADINPPDFETRVAIIKKKATQLNIEIDDEILRYVASKITSNIRELEGAIKKIISYHRLMQKDINMSLAEEALKDFNITNKKKITPEMIISAVENHFSLRENDLKSSKKTRDISYPRQIAMYIIQTLLDLPLTKTAQIFGKKDHTTIMHGIRKIEDDYKKDANIHAAIDDIIKNIKQQ